MMYRRTHISHKLLSFIIVCSSALTSVSYKTYAEDDGRSVLKVYIPNVASLPSYFISYFNAGNLQYDPNNLLVSASGGVEVEQGDTIVRADTIEYDQRGNTVKARGDVAVLAPDGKVSFSDEIELTAGIKGGIIRQFQKQMADNDMFMAAEAKEYDTHIPETVVAKNETSFFDRMLEYFSFGSLSDGNPSRLAELAPAAGETAVVPKDSPVIGNVPLIVLPEPDADSTTKNATKNAMPEPAGAVVNPPIDKQETPPVVTNVIPTPVEPVPVVSPVMPVALAKPQQENTAADIINFVPSAKPDKVLEKKSAEKQEIPVTTQIKTLQPEEKSDVKTLPDSVVEEKPVKEPVKEQVKKKPKPAKKIVREPVKETVTVTGELRGEPAETLPPQSRELLNKISPSIRPQAAKPVKPLKVNHTRDMQDLFKADETVSADAQNETLGVKVEMKNQKLNLDYELEKAYNAINSGNSDAAIVTYKNILDNAPNNTQALFGLATLYHRARQFDKARPLYSRLLTISPNHRDGFNNFLVMLADEAPHEALSELAKLEEGNPGFSTIPAQMAVIYQKLGESDKAIGKMFRAVALAPENLTYRYNLAIMLDKNKNYDEAAKLYRQLIEAVERGEKIPGNIANIQQRLTFISSNR